ncbi:MAG: thiamine phosphate synthase [Alphaproteobacteria bacterium]|nr:thiamine phosphate synthase [Alphaproteobacteria bacterium]MBL6951978.1 thiamine phosphate synthase [Alphaproteobacteria bacterium]
MSTASLTKLSLRLNRGSGYFGRLPGVILLTDATRLADPLPAAAALPKGSAIILRHYAVAGREALGRELMALCRRRGLSLLIAGDWRLAWKLGAHGVHLPEWQAGRPPVLPRKPGWLITAAAHSRPALLRAARLGVNAALLSPVFPTSSHPGAAALGVLRFAALALHCPLPIYALGGIAAGNATRLASSGAAGIAAISGLANPGVSTSDDF